MSDGSLELELVRLVEVAPADADRPMAVTAVTDTIACMLAGASEPASSVVLRALAPGGDGESSVIGSRRRIGTADAALVNGTSAHALDYDDVLDVAWNHPSAVLVPAILALAEEIEANGAAVVDAYLAGLRVTARLGEVMGSAHYATGWHSTSTIGAMAAAASCARLLELDAEATLAAISVSTSMAGGVKRQFGTMAKPIHAGLAANAGILAARLGRAGLVAATDVLEGSRGFVECYGGAGESVSTVVADEGATMQHRLWTKLYPSCASTHRGIDGVLELRRDERLRADAVDEIVVHISSLARQSVPFDHPVDGLEAKFSLPYCVASALVDGVVRLDSFSQEAVDRPVVRSLSERVRVLTYERAGDDERERAHIEVKTRDGRCLSRDVVEPSGSPGRPPSEVDLREKFLECARGCLDEEGAEEVFDRCLGLDALGAVRDLTDAISAACRPDAANSELATPVGR